MRTIQNTNQSSQSSGTPGGFTMVEVMIAVGILTVVILGATLFMSRQFRSMSHVERETEIVSMKTIILSNMDCAYTLKQACFMNEPYIYAKKERVLYSGRYITEDTEDDISGWVLRSVCVNGNLTLWYSRMAPGGKFATDPMTKKPYRWKPMFEESVCMLPKAGPLCPLGHVLDTIDFDKGGIGCRNVEGKKKVKRIKAY